MQMVMTMLINIIKANIHEHIRSITLKWVEMRLPWVLHPNCY